MLKNQFQPPVLKKEKILKMEKLIDQFEKLVKPKRGFIIYGANQSSAWLDYARAVTRRTELDVLNLKNKLAPEIFSYLNRLSSLFYAMARLVVKKSGKKEKNPTYD